MSRNITGFKRLLCFSQKGRAKFTPFGNFISAGNQPKTKGLPMGDKSPKAAQKQKNQQNAKNNSAAQAKQKAALAKKAVDNKKK